MILAGKYIARPVAVGLVDPKGDGKRQVFIDFELKDGRTIGWYGSINEQEKNGISALQITVEALRALGWEGSNLAEIDFPKGSEALITIAHEMWGGRVREKVTNVTQPVLDRSAVPQDQALDIAHRLAGAVAGFRGRNERGSNGRRGNGGDDFANYDDQEHAD